MKKVLDLIKDETQFLLDMKVRDQLAELPPEQRDVLQIDALLRYIGVLDGNPFMEFCCETSQRRPNGNQPINCWIYSSRFCIIHIYIYIFIYLLFLFIYVYIYICIYIYVCVCVSLILIVS